MKLSYTTVDVFTKTRYQGNPLAIVHVPASQRDTLTQAQKQSISREFNLSETIFLHESSPQSKSIIIDIFTPDAEIPFGGHPTIGCTWYLLCSLNLSHITTIETKAGPIAIVDSEEVVRAALPHNVHVHKHTVPCALNDQLNPIISIVRGVSFILVRLPDLAALSKANSTLHEDTYNPSILDEDWQVGLIGTLYYVPTGTAPSGNASYRTRMHINFEDPATGAASGAFAAYLAMNEGSEKGNGPFTYSLTQGVEMGKESDITVEATRKPDGKIESVFLAGTAVKVMEGTLEV
jgi:PhzF family phenazine biosynthesis protein